jgi:hypothetical protein
MLLKEKPIQLGTRDFNMISLDPGKGAGDRFRSGFHPTSTWRTLKLLALSWFRRRGLLLALREIRSCRQRIRLGRRKRWDTAGLVFEEIRASVQPLTFPRNCSETLSCTLSIQALETARPWMTPADHELFAQAWFQAARWYAHRSKECDRRGLDSSDTPEAEILDRP